jgi:hypothetical protein
MFEQLRRAIEQNNISQFTEILDRLLADPSFDLNGKDEYGTTLLGRAAEACRVGTAHQLGFRHNLSYK